MIELKVDHDHRRWVNPWQIKYVEESGRLNHGTRVVMADKESFDVKNPPAEVVQLWQDAMGDTQMFLDEDAAAALSQAVAGEVAGAVKG